MKKMIAAMILLSGVMLILAGCGPSDDTLIIGNWYLTTQSYDTNVYTLNTTHILSAYYADKTVISYDRSSSSGPYEHTNKGTYSVNPDTKALNFSVNGYVESYIYSLPDNDTLKLVTPSGDNKVFKRW
ncbi:MAG: hypothetical protein HPY53_15560 [Brevinematales bacterium]|nr:hypothetical protein [Brevinematales bacterium]